MNIFLITIDIGIPHISHFKKVTEYFDKMAKQVRIMPHTWVVKSVKSMDKIASDLIKATDDKAEFVIVPIDKEFVFQKLSDKTQRELSEEIFTQY